MSEWVKFRVGTPSKDPNWPNPDCRPFESVYHVSHIGPSLSILQNKKIRASLVFDEDRENMALASLFKSKNDFTLSVARLTGEHTGLDNWPDLMKRR